MADYPFLVLFLHPSYKSALSNDALLESAIPGYMEQQHQNMMQEHAPSPLRPKVNKLCKKL